MRTAFRLLAITFVVLGAYALIVAAIATRAYP